MGTFLKYAFYLALILVVYLVGKGIYNGEITQTTTVGEVVNNVEDGAKTMAKDANSAVQEQLEDYEQHPKAEVTVMCCAMFMPMYMPCR